MAIKPLVVDLSHHNEVADFGNVKAAGIARIIHKATEAIGFVDKMYAVRRGSAMDAGLLWACFSVRDHKLDKLAPVSSSAPCQDVIVRADRSGRTLALQQDPTRAGAKFCKTLPYKLS